MRMTKEKYRQRALKAWKTMHDRGFYKYKDRSKDELYNNPKKNKVRNKIVNLIKKYGGKTVLTLETHKFLIPILLKNHTFFVAENNEEEFIKMLKDKPKNVFLHFGDIAQMSYTINNYDTIYLDFCCSYQSAVDIINSLQQKILRCNLVGFTFCLRGNKKYIIKDDYRLDLLAKLNVFLGNDFICKYWDSYADSTPMITLFYINKNFKDKLKLKNKTQEEIQEMEREKDEKDNKYFSEDNNLGIDMCKWAIEKINLLFPHIWDPRQIFNLNAVKHYINNDAGHIIVEKLFMLALNENKMNFPHSGYYRKEYVRSYDEIQGLYNYFVYMLHTNIDNLWRKKYEKEIRFWTINWDNFSQGGYDLFLMDHGKKSIENCYVCNNKDSMVKFEGKILCMNCFIDYIIGNSLLDDIENNKNFKEDYASIYFPKKCHYCIKNIDGKDMIDRRGYHYCSSCYEGIKLRLKEISISQQDLIIKIEKKREEVYGKGFISEKKCSIPICPTCRGLLSVEKKNNICLCGCGMETKGDAKWIQGHCNGANRQLIISEYH
jgi:hypothetical protein